MLINEEYYNNHQTIEEQHIMEALAAGLTENQKNTLGVIEDILESPKAVITNPETGNGLLLSENINVGLKDSVVGSLIDFHENTINSALDAYLVEDYDEKPGPLQPGEEEEDSYEDEEEKPGPLQPGEKPEKKESFELDFASDEDRVLTQEAILDLLGADSFVVAEDIEHEGVLIDETSPYYADIVEALLSRLVETCLNTEELEVIDEVINAYENEISLSETGVSTYEGKGATLKGAAKQVGDKLKNLSKGASKRIDDFATSTAKKKIDKKPWKYNRGDDFWLSKQGRVDKVAKGVKNRAKVGLGAAGATGVGTAGVVAGRKSKTSTKKK
jgi:hypothetical protein